MKTTGVREVSRIRQATSIPSIAPSMLMSISTRSGRSVSIARSASSPRATVRSTR